MGTHRFDSHLFIRCGINSCTEQYRKFESFRSHVYRKHREVLTGPSSPAEDSGSTSVISTNEDHQLLDNNITVVGDGIVEAPSIIHDQKRSAALFILKTREERRVTQTALSGIIQDVQGLWRDTVNDLKVNTSAEIIQIISYSLLFRQKYKGTQTT